MGRITTKYIRGLTDEVLEDHRDKFTNNFEKNKQVLGEIVKISSKKTRNKLAGSITVIIKSQGLLRTFEAPPQPQERRNDRRGGRGRKRE